MEIITKSSGQTQEFGRDFASKLKGGEILALVGDLGSGKTTFVQGLARGLGVEGKIVSPTFVLMREYNIKIRNPKFEIRNLYHLDVYRLEENVEREIKNLGIEDILGSGENIIVIEWADKIKNILSEKTVWICFEAIDDYQRRIVVKNETIY